MDWNSDWSTQRTPKMKDGAFNKKGSILWDTDWNADWSTASTKTAGKIERTLAAPGGKEASVNKKAKKQQRKTEVSKRTSFRRTCFSYSPSKVCF